MEEDKGPRPGFNGFDGGNSRVRLEISAAEGRPHRRAWNALVRALFLLLLVGGIALLRRETDWKRRRLWQTGLIVLLWFDVFTHAPNLSPTAACSIYEPDLIRQFFKWDNQLQAGVSRAMQSKALYKKMFFAGFADPAVDATGRRLSLSQNFNLLDHVPTFEGFYSLDLKEPLECSEPCI